jgi:cytochrome c-type biogenesis protein CcmI
MMLVATGLLVVALPFLLWPLVRPPAAEPEVTAAGEAAESIVHQVEEVELDHASGRLDRAEADRRVAELRARPR